MLKREREEREALNYQKVLGYIQTLAQDPARPVTEDIIKHINRIVLDGIPEFAGRAGEYKVVQNYLVNRLDGTVIYTPPTPEETPTLMWGLVDWLDRRRKMVKDYPAEPILHPIVTAALVCHELMRIHPFDEGNGRSSRALATLILMQHGYIGVQNDDRLRPVKSLEWYFDRHLQKYYSFLRMADPPKKDLIPWIEFFTEAVQATMTIIQDEKVGPAKQQSGEPPEGTIH